MLPYQTWYRPTITSLQFRYFQAYTSDRNRRPNGKRRFLLRMCDVRQWRIKPEWHNLDFKTPWMYKYEGSVNNIKNIRSAYFVKAMVSARPVIKLRNFEQKYIVPNCFFQKNNSFRNLRLLFGYPGMLGDHREMRF